MSQEVVLENVRQLSAATTVEREQSCVLSEVRATPQLMWPNKWKHVFRGAYVCGYFFKIKILIKIKIQIKCKYLLLRRTKCTLQDHITSSGSQIPYILYMRSAACSHKSHFLSANSEQTRSRTYAHVSDRSEGSQVWPADDHSSSPSRWAAVRASNEMTEPTISNLLVIIFRLSPAPVNWDMESANGRLYLRRIDQLANSAADVRHNSFPWLN